MERRKVAMYKSRRVAILHSASHLIPLAGATTLLALRWSKFWVGQEFDGTFALQFLAKLHELLMQMSLVEVLLCVIRTAAINDFVPLGALSAFAQPTQLSYLWSIDFVSIFKSSTHRGWRKTFFILMIPVVFALITLVGPSSAILMIPRPGLPHVNNTHTFRLNRTMGSLYPEYIDGPSGLSLSVIMQHKINRADRS